MGTATLGARLLAVLSSLGAAVVLAPVAFAHFNGGGAAKSDCYIVYEDLEITSGNNKSECTDGDPSCDTDGQCQGTCSFGITACFNDPNVADCTPTNVTAVTVKGTTLNLATLLPTSENVCGEQAIVGVPVKKTAKGAKKGKLKVKVKATSVSKPKTDKDAFTLFCLPREEGACPTTTTTSSTTSTTVETCCELPSAPKTSASFLSFATEAGTGKCGSYIDIAAVPPAAKDLNCSGLYFGGGGNSVPLPVSVPDQGVAVSKIAACSKITNTATIVPATAAETGNPRNCTAAGCVFGAPLAVPNPNSTPTSTCVVNRISADITGSVSCTTGASDLSAPLSSEIYLTGDTYTDPMSTIAGIQPCPLCTGGSCIGGPNNGLPCTPGTTDLGDGYPTSHDCPPDPMSNIGSLPVAFSLTTGTVTWTGSAPTNDTGSTVSVQNRVFSGYCRDADGTGAFEGTSGATAHKCWENGMAVGTACSGTFESCEQKNNGAFGPGGGGVATIIAIGSASGNLFSGPAKATLASVFSISPTFNATVDAAGDLPGPGAVTLPGTASLCADAMTCP
jgi:hypothetical protein